jgi:hypothetical protein
MGPLEFTLQRVSDARNPSVSRQDARFAASGFPGPPQVTSSFLTGAGSSTRCITECGGSRARRARVGRALAEIGRWCLVRTWPPESGIRRV